MADKKTEEASSRPMIAGVEVTLVIRKKLDQLKSSVDRGVTKLDDYPRLTCSILGIRLAKYKEWAREQGIDKSEVDLNVEIAASFEELKHALIFAFNPTVRETAYGVNAGNDIEQAAQNDLELLIGKISDPRIHACLIDVYKNLVRREISELKRLREIEGHELE